MEETPKTLYQRGASSGFILGILFCAIFLSMAWSSNLSLLGLLSSVLALAVPFVVYAQLRKTYVDERGMTIYAALWMQGITAFACGGLILCLLVYIHLRWIDPSFIANQVDLLIETYSTVENQRTREMVEMMQNIKQYDAYPSPRDIVLQVELMTIFTGSILSMLMSLLVILRKLPQKK